MRHVVADDAIERGFGTDRAKPELVNHACGGNLSGRHRIAGIRPARSEARGQEPRWNARVSHRNHYGIPRAGDLEKRQRITEACRRHRDLDQRCASLPHRSRAGCQIRRHASEVVRRQDHARRILAYHRGEPGTPFDVDILRAGVECFHQHCLTPLLAALEPTALPRRTTGCDDREPATAERTSYIHVRDAIQTELDQVDVARGFTCGNQPGHRPAGHGLNEKRMTHHRKNNPKNTNAPSTGWLKRRWSY